MTLLVQYLSTPHAERLCDRDGCAEPLTFTAIAMDGAIIDYLCTRHAAQHMRGNAYALDPDPEPEAIEAMVQNELDRYAR